MDYSKYKPNFSMYEHVVTRFNSRFRLRSFTYAGCKNEEELSNLMGALFYIVYDGKLTPAYQAQFPILKDWRPGDHLPYECEQLLNAPK